MRDFLIWLFVPENFYVALTTLLVVWTAWAAGKRDSQRERQTIHGIKSHDRGRVIVNGSIIAGSKVDIRVGGRDEGEEEYVFVSHPLRDDEMLAIHASIIAVQNRLTGDTINEWRRKHGYDPIPGANDLTLEDVLQDARIVVMGPMPKRVEIDQADPTYTDPVKFGELIKNLKGKK